MRLCDVCGHPLPSHAPADQTVHAGYCRSVDLAQKEKQTMPTVKALSAMPRHRRRSNTIIKPPTKAIRAFCLECMGYQNSLVPKCSAPECHLWPYRLGGGSIADDMAQTG